MTIAQFERALKGRRIAAREIRAREANQVIFLGKCWGLTAPDARRAFKDLVGPDPDEPGKNVDMEAIAHLIERSHQRAAEAKLKEKQRKEQIKVG